MTRYSFIRVTRSFVFPSLFNHFLGCSPTALNAHNQKMLGNKETHVYARDTRIQTDAKIQRRTDVGTTSVAYLNLVIQICSTFFLLPSLESLSCFSFISLFSSFFFLFFFCTCICILSTSYFLLFFRLLHFTLPARVTVERFWQCFRADTILSLPSLLHKVVLFAVKKMDDLTSFPNTI